MYNARIPDYTELVGNGEPEWQGLYPGATEESDREWNPKPRGREVVSTYVDADHARDEATTRRSVMGVLIFWNCTPICWYSSKRQATVESSTYSSELVAARIATEMVLARDEDHVEGFGHTSERTVLSIW